MGSIVELAFFGQPDYRLGLDQAMHLFVLILTLGTAAVNPARPSGK